MKPRESKAVRLVAEGRVRILDAPGEVRAEVKGDTATYSVLWSPDPTARMCQCKANRQGHLQCSHLIAVELHQLAEQEGQLHAS